MLPMEMTGYTANILGIPNHSHSAPTVAQPYEVASPPTGARSCGNPRLVFAVQEPVPSNKGVDVTANRIEVQYAQKAGRFWWMWLATGILWTLIAGVILQFNITSAATVGVLVGVMILFAGIEYIAISTQVEGWKWLWMGVGILLIVGGFVAMLYPTRTFLSIANILGFIFLMIGVSWMIEAFASRDMSDLWWLSLVAGIIMVVMGFWLSGQFLFAKAETLLIFAGIWALMRGVLSIVTAFQVKKLVA